MDYEEFTQILMYLLSHKKRNMGYFAIYYRGIKTTSVVFMDRYVEDFSKKSISFQAELP